MVPFLTKDMMIFLSSFCWLGNKEWSNVLCFRDIIQALKIFLVLPRSQVRVRNRPRKKVQSQERGKNRTRFEDDSSLKRLACRIVM